MYKVNNNLNRAERAVVKKPVLDAESRAFIQSRVLHNDAHVILFDKPAGLSSQGGRIAAHTLDDLTWAFAKASGNRPRLIHRLDRDTSGVLLAAHTHPAASFLGKALMAKRFRKAYLALVTPGALVPPNGALSMALRRETLGREAYMRLCSHDHPDAQAALTDYRTLDANPQAALLELNPETGRMHQLRVHLAGMGHPIAGDPRYGGTLTLAGYPVPRLMLHAYALSFPHPGGGTFTATAPLPDDFETLLTRAGLQMPAR